MNDISNLFGDVKNTSHPWFIPHKWSRWTIEGDFQIKACLKCNFIMKRRISGCDHVFNPYPEKKMQTYNRETNGLITSYEAYACLHCSSRKVVHFDPTKVWIEIVDSQ